jgi:hypothetical protein
MFALRFRVGWPPEAVLALGGGHASGPLPTFQLAGWGGLRIRMTSATAGAGHFRDGNQRDIRADKKMLKKRVAPNMLLKTKGRETANSVLANMFLKTNSLSHLPICY